MLITSARVAPVTRGPLPGANGPSSARNCKPANVSAAGNGEVAPGEEVSHGRQRVEARCLEKSQRLADVLGVHDDLAKVGRGMSRGGSGAADDGAEPIERFRGSAAAVLDHPAVVVHLRAEPRPQHAAQPPPLVQAGRSDEVSDDLLEVPLPAQGAVPPLPCAEARQVLRQRCPLGVR